MSIGHTQWWFALCKTLVAKVFKKNGSERFTPVGFLGVQMATRSFQLTELKLKDDDSKAKFHDNLPPSQLIVIHNNDLASGCVGG